ncbi:MAG: hypothetical protein IPN26_03645 [Bacteroidetes bacterium]|nr:hypothetical protein [Bacteroidota bacterium]
MPKAVVAGNRSRGRSNGSGDVLKLNHLQFPARYTMGLQSMRVNHVADVFNNGAKKPRIVMELQAEPEPVVEQATPH